MKTNILLLAFSMLMMQSCLDNEGNYDYKELTPIEIDEASLQTSYRITQLETLTIEPDVKQGTDDSNLSYEWRIAQPWNQPNTETGTVINEVVGHERRLDYKVTIPPGEYYLMFTATDKKTGVSVLINRPLNIESFAPVGLMVMHGNNKESDISILVNDRMVSEVTKDEVKHNIFSVTNGEKIPGAPGKVAYFINPRVVCAMTVGPEGGCKSRGSDLAKQGTYKDLFAESLEGDACFQGFDQWSYNNLLIDNGKLYFTSAPDANFVPFGIPCFGLDYYAEPYIGTNNYGYVYGAIYDRLSRRFLYINYQRTITAFKESASTAPFNMNNVGLDMMYASMGFNNNWYCLMKDPADNLKMYVLVCNFMNLYRGDCSAAKYDVSASPELATANAFDFGNRSELMYFATDDAVKQCNYTGDGASTVRYAIPAELKAAGYKINYIQVFKNNIHANNGRLLYIGLYNATTDEGKLVECPFVESTGELKESEIKIYDGFKRITHACYKMY